MEDNEKKNKELILQIKCIFFFEGFTFLKKTTVIILVYI
jgi:hypothetical protein